jgi:D-tyrosyl-tRNA(Tyr) deacylase
VFELKAVVQRVNHASVTVDEELVSGIERGLLILLGVAQGDTEEDARYLAGKIANMRIFPDPAGKMNLSVKDIEGSALVVSQFTLLADTKKGRRPSYVNAEAPERASELCDFFSGLLTNDGIPTQEGRFGAMMDVALVNAGPVTIIIDSDQRNS